MLTLPLDPTDDRAHPAFKDVASCLAWLGQLQLTNLHQAHSVVRGQIDEFGRYPMRGLERLNTLELLRETVAHLQDDYAKKLIAKKLPLSEDELTMFVAIVGLWQGMVTGYQRCLQAYMSGDKQLTPFAALLSQRCLLYSGLQIFEHLRAGYEFNPKLWQQLHELYEFTELQALDKIEVEETLHGSKTQTCRAVYAKTLLACYARPAELSRGQLQCMERWLTQWSALLTVEKTCSVSKGDAPPLAVDLSKPLGLQPLPASIPPETFRYVAMVPISKDIRVKNLLLQQGGSPQQQGLGLGINATECIDFLNYLHQQWCEGRGTRQIERRSVLAQAQVCYGLEGIYAYICNKPFKQPGKDMGMSSTARKQIETFGRVLSDTNRHDLTTLGFIAEAWQLEDESILGARLIRTSQMGMRIAPNQLIALRAEDANAFMLSTVRWVMVMRSGQLQIGVRHLPGVPQPVSIRATGVNQSVSDKYVPAMLLPAVPMLKSPVSLVVPREWFLPERVVEVAHINGEKTLLKMGFSVEKGLDFERVSFVPM
jgi:cyclic-di-GMP-binding protein